MREQEFTASLTPVEDTEGRTVIVEQFKLTDIPDAMDKMGWAESAKIMRHWFSGEPYVLDMKVKKGELPTSNLSNEKIYSNIDFEWLYKATNRVQPWVEKLIAELRYVREINNRVGKQGVELSAGLLQLMLRLDKFGAVNEQQKKLNTNSFNFSEKNALELDEASQFNFILIGTGIINQALDALDDVYGTLGGFSIKIAATKIRTISEQHSTSTIFIEEIGLYIRDAYDFLNDDDDDQLLGYWGDGGALDPSLYQFLVKPAFIDSDGKRYFRVTNQSFNNYRSTYKKGGDLIVFSSVLHFPTDISIPLHLGDFTEYTNWKAKKLISEKQ